MVGNIALLANRGFSKLFVINFYELIYIFYRNCYDVNMQWKSRGQWALSSSSLCIHHRVVLCLVIVTVNLCFHAILVQCKSICTCMHMHIIYFHFCKTAKRQKIITLLHAVCGAWICAGCYFMQLPSVQWLVLKYCSVLHHVWGYDVATSCFAHQRKFVSTQKPVQSQIFTVWCMLVQYMQCAILSLVYSLEYLFVSFISYVETMSRIVAGNLGQPFENFSRASVSHCMSYHLYYANICN